MESLSHSLTHSLTHTHTDLHSLSFAWQAWHNLHCQGVGCTPWRPLGLRLVCVAGVGQCSLPRGLMYALAFLVSPPLLRRRLVTICTAKVSDVRPGVPCFSASFVWQVWRIAEITPALTHSLTHSITYIRIISIIIIIIIIIIVIIIIIITIIIIMYQRCLAATWLAERVHKMCGCARGVQNLIWSAEVWWAHHRFDSMSEKNIAWWNPMKAKQFTHNLPYVHTYIDT